MKKIAFGFILLTFFACVKEHKFGKSTRKEVKTFAIPGQSGNTTIDHQNLTITVPMPNNTIDFQLTPNEITTSNFSSIVPKQGQTQNFSTPVGYTVTAEDGSMNTYMVSIELTGDKPQLENRSFEDWYVETVGSKNVDQPGISKENTIWGTANRGLALGGANGNTSKQTKTDSLFVKMETVAAPALVRIAAATLFTGKFTENFPSVSDPRSNLTLGVPFSGRPQGFSFSYKYTPGASNEDSNGNSLPYGDQCDIYLLLENRSGSKTKRVGTAWFRDGTTVSQWTKTTVPVKYGPLDASDPWYAYAQPQPDEEWGTGTENVTHITVLFSSSFEGDFFSGAIGSTLEVDNVLLNY